MQSWRKLSILEQMFFHIAKIFYTNPSTIFRAGNCKCLSINATIPWHGLCYWYGAHKENRKLNKIRPKEIRQPKHAGWLCNLLSLTKAKR
jgi:hypothetical protein